MGRMQCYCCVCIQIHSIGINGLNGRATFVETPDPDKRFEPHKPLLKPWNPHGDYVLICGQVPGDAALGVDLKPIGIAQG